MTPTEQHHELCQGLDRMVGQLGDGAGTAQLDGTWVEVAAGLSAYAAREREALAAPHPELAARHAAIAVAADRVAARLAHLARDGGALARERLHDAVRRVRTLLDAYQSSRAELPPG